MATGHEVQIRRATDDDIDALLDHIEAVAAEGRWLGTESPIDRVKRRDWLRTRAHPADPDGARFVAVADGRIVGSIDVTRDAIGVAELGMAVAAGWRGQGIGTRLMGAVLSWCDDQGRDRVHKVALQVWPHNEPARALYRGLGFVDEGTLARHYRRRDGSLWDAVVMGKVLDHDAPGSPYA